MNNDEKLKTLKKEDLVNYSKSKKIEDLEIVNDYINYAKDNNLPLEEYSGIMDNLYSNKNLDNKLASKIMSNYIKNGINIETDSVALLIQNEVLTEKQRKYLNDVYVETYKKSLSENHLFNQLQEKVEAPLIKDERIIQIDKEINEKDKEIEALRIEMEKNKDFNNFNTLFKNVNKRIENFKGDDTKFQNILKEINKIARKNDLKENDNYKIFENELSLKLVNKRIKNLDNNINNIKNENFNQLSKMSFNTNNTFNLLNNSNEALLKVNTLKNETKDFKDLKKVFLKELETLKELENFDEKILKRIETNKQLDLNIDNFINQIKIEDSNKKVDIKINDYVESVIKSQSYDDFLKSKEDGTYVPYVAPVKEKKIKELSQSYDDYLKKNQEKINKLDNQNTQVVKKYVEVVKLDVPKESVEEQIQFNREKEKVANLMLESFKINYMAEKGINEIKNHNDFLNFMEDKFITKISNLDDEDLKYKVHNDFESLRDRYIKDNKVDRQHNGSSTSKNFLDDKNKYLAAHAAQEVPDVSIGDLIF